ncbi:MAG: hypothetical protein Q8N51_07145 [Gammaproteobacteria bacterium]|nr:hypothetical protein [Gammaproteobacteria bacterium]
MSAVMGLPESVTYLLLVVLGYALVRVVDLVSDYVRGRLRGTSGHTDDLPMISATARQRLMERRAVYTRFRKSVNAAVEAAVNAGHGNYGMLYQIRDDYGDLLRHSPTGVSHAADSIIRCVTLLVNLGPSDQRYAMFTRALNHFDEECRSDDGLVVAPSVPRRQEFSVLDETRCRAENSSEAACPQSESDSESAHVRT